MKKEKIISSLIYKFTEKILTKGVGLIITIVLARILAPEIFGQLAILMVFINLSQMIIEGGLSTALVQKKETDEMDYSVVYYLSTAVAVLLVIILFLGAPLIASFYNAPELIWPLRVYSFVLFFGAFNSVQVARLQKQMRFKSMMWVNLIATILSGAFGLVLALTDFGLWALVLYDFAHVVLVSVLMCFIVKWFPKLQFSGARAKTLFGFGWKMLVSSVLCSLYGDVRSLVIGKKHTTADLGYYNKGKQFPEVLSIALDQSVRSVMFPAIASEQDKIDKVRVMLKRSLTLGSFLIIPLMVGMALVAEPFVRVVLTEKWMPSVFYLQMLSLGYISIPITSANLTVIKSMGRSDMYMILEVIRRVMMIIVLLITIFVFGTVEAIAVGFVVSSFLDCIIVLIPMKKFIGFGIVKQFISLFKIIIAVLLMSVCTWAVSLFSISALGMLLLQILVGIVSYILFCAIIKVDSFYYVLGMIKKLFKSKGEKKDESQKEDSNNECGK